MSNQPPLYLNPNLVNVEGVEGELLYTEKVTKTTTYDKDGNVLEVSSNIDREPAHPGIDALDHASCHLPPDGILRSSRGYAGAASGPSPPHGRSRTMVEEGTQTSSGIGASSMETGRAHGRGIAATSNAASKAIGEVPSQSTRQIKITDPGMSL